MHHDKRQPFLPSTRSSNLKSTLRDIVGAAKKQEAKGKKVYYFNLGDPNKFDFDTPDYLKDALVNALEKGAGHYSGSQGDEELLEAIAKRENRKNGTSLTEKDVLVTQGISEGLFFLFGALIEHGKGDEVLLPGPTYPNYLELTKFFGGVPVTYKTDENNGWNPDVEDIRKKITEKTKAICIINPNNPTGAVYSKSVLKEIVNIAAEHNIILTTDEIYDKLVFGEAEHVGVASIAKDIPVIGLNGFSKLYLVPGWRVGYMYFHDPTGQLEKMKSAINAESRQRLSACTPVMKACAKAYTGPDDHIKELNKKLKERAEFAHKKLNKIPDISAVKPSGAFYIFPRIDMRGRWKSDKEFCLDVLENTGLVLPHGSGFDPVYGKNHFRSVILPPVELMDEAFSKLHEFMEERQ
jgi:aspartate/methionine/tyrosine aminotransferase